MPTSNNKKDFLEVVTSLRGRKVMHGKNSWWQGHIQEFHSLSIVIQRHREVAEHAVHRSYLADGTSFRDRNCTIQYVKSLLHMANCSFYVDMSFAIGNLLLLDDFFFWQPGAWTRDRKRMQNTLKHDYMSQTHLEAGVLSKMLYGTRRSWISNPRSAIFPHPGGADSRILRKPHSITSCPSDMAPE